MRRFEVELKIHFPFKANISARSKEDAVKMTLDETMDYLEAILKNPHKFAEFWEYDAKYEVVSISEDFNEPLK